MMDASFIKAIEELVTRGDANILTEDDKKYSTTPLHRLPAQNSVEPIELHTLTGLCDYLENQRDGLHEGTALYVMSPLGVALHGPLEGQGFENVRHTFAVARHRGGEFPWGRWIPREEAQVLLQARFEDDGEDGERARALALIARIAAEEKVTLEDDGVTQAVVARRGAHYSEELVKNPFMLAPHRTFHEVRQPASPFILRIRAGDGKVDIALHEADGGAWRTTAVRAVREWLKEHTEWPVVA